MAGGLLTRKSVLLAKIEATSGTDPVPTVAANEIEIFDANFTQNAETIRRNPLRSSLSPRPIQKSLKTGELTFTTELKNGGTAGTIGRLDPLFRAAGMASTVSAGSSVIYKPTSTFETATIYFYRDGLLFKSSGCAATGEIVVEAGRIPQIRWTVRGLYTIPVDAAVPSATYESTAGQVAENTATQLDGYAGVVRSYSLNFGNDIVNRNSLNIVGGVVGTRITGRNPTGRMLVEAELRATKDWIAAWDASTVVSFISTIGATAGNKVEISGTSKAQIDNIGLEDENGIFMFNMDLAFSGTDDEFQIKLF